MPKNHKKSRKTTKPIKRLGMEKQDDSLAINDDLIRKISVSAPSTLIILNPTKSVSELKENFEKPGAKNETTDTKMEQGETEDESETSSESSSEDEEEKTDDVFEPKTKKRKIKSADLAKMIKK